MFTTELKNHLVDTEAERYVLAAMLNEPAEAIDLVTGMLTETDFSESVHQKVYRAILALAGRGIPLDPVTLPDQLKKEGTLNEIGGLEFLYDLAGAVPTAAHLEHHARIIKERAEQRHLLEAAVEITRLASEPVEEVAELLDKAETMIQQVRSRSIRGEYHLARELMDRLVSDLEERGRTSQAPGLKTGFYNLDILTGGLHPGELVILAGRPSMGKTALALTLALQIASRPIDGCPIGLFSLEMSREQIIQRLAAMVSGLNTQLFRSDLPTDSDWPRITEAADRLYDLKIFVDDTPSISVLELRARARRLHRQERIGLIVVDYLQLMATPDRRGASREQQVAEISRSLKALARELEIPVLALSQLNRSVESRSDQRPKLADLRESGAIEQDADLVMFIFRPEQAGIKRAENGGSTAGLAELLLEKNRNGPTGAVMLRFEKNSTLFRTLN